MKLNRLLLLSLGFFMLMACKREGCTNQTADNYDKKAKNDNGSCLFNGVNPNNPNNPNNPYNPNDPNDPNDPNQTLPIRLTGTEAGNITIFDKSTNPNVADYYIDGAWNIDANVIVNPGVRIEMRPGAYIDVRANGSINATGTASNKIEIFGAQNVNGYWKNIEFNSNNPNNKLIHCNISNGSTYYSSQPGMIIISNNSQATIQNCNISKGSEFGLMTIGLNAKLPNFQSNHFSSFSKAPIRLASLNHANYLDNSTVLAANNLLPYIYIYSEDVTSNTFVPKMNVAYSIRGNITFKDSHTKVESGVEMRMAANAYMDVTSNASLEFDGTASDPCSIIGDVTSKGYWRNITFNSNNPANRFSYTNISGGSQYYNSQPGVIRLDGTSSIAMNNCHISNASSAAVQGTATSTFNNNGGNTWDDCDGGGGLLP